MGLVNHNGELLPSDIPILNIQNRSFRYGDGLFESLRVVDGLVVLLEHHLQRLTTGMNVLKMSADPDRGVAFWKEQILRLCEDNRCLDKARVRLTIYRKDGGHYEPSNADYGYLIEAESNATVFSNPELEGLNIGVFDEILKPINSLGGVKTANSLIYVLAGVVKDQNSMDDMLILNESGKVAEAISSNIFIVKNGQFSTPSLDEGCVAGVTRDWLITKMRANGTTVEETSLSIEDIQLADEVFVTNAIQGVRRVQCFGDSSFDDAFVREVYRFKPELDERSSG
ncbi:MAG: aminotransferase class IV [Flavobacteriales bacterium]|nr:aminotransferase class IV [Flavobacteriales bacterium]